MATMTVQDVKKALIKWHNAMAQVARTGNYIYEQIANDDWLEAGMNQLDTFFTEGQRDFAEKIAHELNNRLAYSRISEKQAFWAACAICRKNNIDMETVSKYLH